MTTDEFYPIPTFEGRPDLLRDVREMTYRLIRAMVMSERTKHLVKGYTFSHDQAQLPELLAAAKHLSLHSGLEDSWPWDDDAPMLGRSVVEKSFISLSMFAACVDAAEVEPRMRPSYFTRQYMLIYFWHQFAELAELLEGSSAFINASFNTALNLAIVEKTNLMPTPEGIYKLSHEDKMKILGDTREIDKSYIVLRASYDIQRGY